MAGTLTAVTTTHVSRGTVRVKCHLAVSSGGVLTATATPAMWGRLVAILYAPGTLDTGSDITVTDSASGAAILTLTNAGTSNRFFRPTTAITDNTGTAVTPATTAVDCNRDIYVAGALKVAVAQGGTSTEGDITFIVQEG